MNLWTRSAVLSLAAAAAFVVAALCFGGVIHSRGSVWQAVGLVVLAFALVSDRTT